MRMYPNDINLSPELRYKNSLQDIRKEYIEVLKFNKNIKPRVTLGL